MASRYESVRRQLDTLLGADRDQPLSTKSSGPPQPPGIVDIEAPDICKDYLLGLCLSSLSIKRRGGLLVCTKVHSEEARSRFRDLLAQGRPPRDYVRWQHELIDNCRAIVSEEDRRISGAARRLKESYGFTEPPSAIIVQDLGVLQELGILLNGVLSADAQVRNVDEEEDADGLDQDMDRSAALRQEKSEPDLAIKIIGVDGGAKNEETTPVKREKTENALDVSKEEREVKTSTLKEESGAPENAPTLPSKKKEPPLSEAQELARSKLRDSTGVGPGGLLLNRDYKQRVCGQCGGLISLHDAETRLASHYAGKQHTSLVSLRDKLRELESSVRGIGDTPNMVRSDPGFRDSRFPRGETLRPPERSSRSRSRSRSPRHHGYGGRRRRSPEPFHRRGFNGPDQSRHNFKRFRPSSPPRYRRDGPR